MTVKTLKRSRTWITTQEAACFCLDCPECEKVYPPERVQNRKCSACGGRLVDVGYSANGCRAKLKNLAAKNPAVTRLVTRVARDGSRRLHREWSRPILMRTYQDERAAQKEDEARIDAMLNNGPVNGPIPTTQLHLLPADQRLKKHQIDEARRNPSYYLAGGNKYQPTKITRAIDAHRCRETVAHAPDDLHAMLARAKARRQAKIKTVPVQRPRAAEIAAAFLEREIPETGSIDLGEVLELAATEEISRKALRRAARNLERAGWLKRSGIAQLSRHPQEKSTSGPRSKRRSTAFANSSESNPT